MWYRVITRGIYGVRKTVEGRKEAIRECKRIARQFGTSYIYKIYYEGNTDIIRAEVPYMKGRLMRDGTVAVTEWDGERW